MFDSLLRIVYLFLYSYNSHTDAHAAIQQHLLLVQSIRASATYTATIYLIYEPHIMCIIVHKFAEFGLRHCVGVELFVLCIYVFYGQYIETYYTIVICAFCIQVCFVYAFSVDNFNNF